MARAHAPWLRPLAMRLHRWMALALGAWFVLVGLTGSLLVWHAEMDRGLNPQWFAHPSQCVATATPVASALAVFADATRSATATQVMAPAAPRATYVVWEKPGADGLRVQHFIDVDCGVHLGQRKWGAARIDRAHFVPALYELHRSLLSGDVGHIVVGFAGLVFLGVALTGALTAWPRHASRGDWKRVLTIKRGAKTHRRYYDLHRATGMWSLAFLLLMCVTGAYLCFPKQGRALIATTMETSSAALRVPVVPAPPVVPAMAGTHTPDQLVQHAERLWPDATWSRLQLPVDGSGAYDVRLLQREELRADTGDTRVRLNAANEVVDVRDPLRAPAGDTVISWLFPLHSGEALGLAGRAVWTLLGLGPPLLFATGTWLWWKRRKQKRRHARSIER